MKVKEGLAEVNVFESVKPEDAPVFYNPAAELTRDLSVSVLRVFFRGREVSGLDALSGTGIRGIRYAKEAGLDMTFCDNNPKAVGLIQKNVLSNGLRSRVVRSDANKFMGEELFDFVDLDPFGSPAPFIDSAARSVKHNGLLAVTATDTGALCGRFSDACLRKYGIRTTWTDFYTELGVRVLVTNVILSLARQGKAFIPLLGISDRHYIRVFGHIDGTGRILGLLKNIGILDYCSECFTRGEKCKHGGGIGPLYLGKIFDIEFCQDVLGDVAGSNYSSKGKLLGVLEKIIRELPIPYYFDLHKVCKKFERRIPSFDDLFDKLGRKGFVCSRTLFCETGFKTDAGIKDVLKCLKK